MSYSGIQVLEFASLNLFFSFCITELLHDNPACVHCLVTKHILDCFERFHGSLPSVDPEGTGTVQLYVTFFEGVCGVFQGYCMLYLLEDNVGM